jgi:hypothetical protein
VPGGIDNARGGAEIAAHAGQVDAEKAVALRGAKFPVEAGGLGIAGDEDVVALRVVEARPALDGDGRMAQLVAIRDEDAAAGCGVERLLVVERGKVDRALRPDGGRRNQQRSNEQAEAFHV